MRTDPDGEHVVQASGKPRRLLAPKSESDEVGHVLCALAGATRIDAVVAHPAHWRICTVDKGCSCESEAERGRLADHKSS